MSDLAMSLGHSLLFPVTCRYCKLQIWLFADPDGGFAIFDELGRPWPKHFCDGFRDPATYHEIPSICLDSFDFPVPPDTPVAGYNDGKTLTGTIVKVVDDANFSDEEVYQVVIYNGHALYYILSRKQLSLGIVVTGVAKSVPGNPTFLEEVTVLDPGFRSPSRKKSDGTTGRKRRAAKKGSKRLANQSKLRNKTTGSRSRPRRGQASTLLR